MRGVHYGDLVLGLLREIKETWDIRNEIVHDVLGHGMVLQVEKADVEKSMPELANKLGLVSLVIGKGKIEDRESGEVSSHRE